MVAQHLAAEDQNIQVIEQKSGEGKQVALQKSFPLSKGDIVYLTDIDCLPSDESIHNLLRYILDDQYSASVVTGLLAPCLNSLIHH